jgi:hypothetical protein
VYFQPDEVNAAIVTCGGLCPGLNTVIRELVCGLYDMYGVTSVVGIEVRTEELLLCSHLAKKVIFLLLFFRMCSLQCIDHLNHFSTAYSRIGLVKVTIIDRKTAIHFSWYHLATRRCIIV